MQTVLFFKYTFVKHKWFFLIEIALDFVSNEAINNEIALVLIMAWCWSGDKPLYDPMMIYFVDEYMRQIASLKAFSVTKV